MSECNSGIRTRAISDSPHFQDPLRLGKGYVTYHMYQIFFRSMFRQKDLIIFKTNIQIQKKECENLYDECMLPENAALCGDAVRNITDAVST